jgi:hypothetical protein
MTQPRTDTPPPAAQGANKGIGFEIARLLAESGMHVVVAARNRGWPLGGGRPGPRGGGGRGGWGAPGRATLGAWR